MTSKRVLILAKTEYSRTPFDQWLSGTGYQPIIITNRENFEDYKSKIGEVFSLDDYADDSACLELSRKIYAYSPFERVFSRWEFDLTRAARIRKEFNLAGQVEESAIAFRDKKIMKDFVVRSEVRVPAYAGIVAVNEVASFAAAKGFPIVIKPRDESGSSGVEIIRNEMELEEWMKETEAPARSLLIEQFVDGAMYHVDGLVLGGKLAFIHPFEYVNDCLSYRSNDYIGNVPLTNAEPLYHRLVNATQSVIESLPNCENYAFHCELWADKNENIWFCEIAARTGGGMISFLVKHQFGIDLDKAWLRGECGFETEIQPFEPHVSKLHGCICIPPISGKLVSVPESEPGYIVERHFPNKIGDYYSGGTKSGLYLIGYVLSAADRGQLLQRMSECYEWFYQESKWLSV